MLVLVMKVFWIGLVNLAHFIRSRIIYKSPTGILSQ